jgi:hypothetical protein
MIPSPINRRQHHAGRMNANKDPKADDAIHAKLPDLLVAQRYSVP